VTTSSRITSTSNRRLKRVRRLLRHGAAAGVFAVQGHRQLRCALEAGARVVEVYAARELFLGADDEKLVAWASRTGAEVVEVGPEAFRSTFRAARADGIAGVVERWSTALDSASLGDAPLVLVAEAIERPGNLGTMIRSACAAGASAVAIADGALDPFKPDVVRGSVGTIFHIPLLHGSSDEVSAWLAERAVAVVAATPEASAPYWSVDYSGATAVAVGSERHGLTAGWLRRAQTTVSIPMPGRADSLNAAVAASVVLFEAARQRLGATERRQRRERAVAAAARRS
jgi:TrmH family RNA methyltransferase